MANCLILTKFHSLKWLPCKKNPGVLAARSLERADRKILSSNWMLSGILSVVLLPRYLRITRRCWVSNSYSFNFCDNFVFDCQATLERTTSLEEVIKQRIRDERWDSIVPRKILQPAKTDADAPPELSQEKSSVGLGELYEKVSELI